MLVINEETPKPIDPPLLVIRGDTDLSSQLQSQGSLQSSQVSAKPVGKPTDAIDIERVNQTNVELNDEPPTPKAAVTKPAADSSERADTRIELDK